MCGLVGGLLVTAVLPSTTLVGLAGGWLVSLPRSLQAPPSQQASYVYANDGKTLITTFYDQNRRNVGLADIAPVMQQAIVAAEDTRFYQHHGVDVKGMARALVSNVRTGQAGQGGSTLTMQYVRNVLKNDPALTPQQRQAATAGTPLRKVQEMRYATALERKLSKQDILDRYLNIAYFGHGAYGIDAASHTYFGKPPSQLGLGESALLAGLVQSPDAYDPISGDRAGALARRSYVLDAMAKMKDVSTGEAATAKAEPLALHPQQQPNNCTAVPAAHNDWGFFCDYFHQWWKAQPQFGATVADRERALNAGGYTIVTSLDPSIQATAQEQSLSVYGYDSPRVLPMAVVQPGTGRVTAMAVNRHYSLDANPNGQSYPNTVNQLVAGGGGVNGYQAGSTFKLFTMLAALSSGTPLNTTFDAQSPFVTKWPASGDGSCDGYWCPVDANPAWMDGQRTMWGGYGRSVNTYFVWLEQQVGPQNAVAMAQRLGITFRSPSDAALAANPDSWGAFTLGVSDTTPLDLANAYATVAAGGTYCAPLPVASITDASGHRVAAADPTCRRAVSADVAAAAADAARCPVGQESAYNRCDGGTAPEVSAILGGRPVAGKTGSSDGSATETFVGFTPQLAAAGIATNPENPQDHVGGSVSARVNRAVATTLATALNGQPYQDFPVPSNEIAFGGRG
ncbi:transglycosylase domain-containing protein [Planosporangium mesophilum]|nr:transglycosylase domain-containing protein [Planosporangium mesophilum]NJC84505.1 penicillin-binding protein [Planosporangium mesophilum]